MAQLTDLPDDCLLELLDRMSPQQLMKMRLNKRLNQLAASKMRTKIKAIWIKTMFNNPMKRPADCSFHINSPDQVLILMPKYDRRHPQVFKDELLCDSPRKAIFFSIMSRCPSVESVNLDYFELPEGLIIEVFRRCRQLKCLKLSPSFNLTEEWGRILNRFGNQMIHIAKNRILETHCTSGYLETRLLATVVKECPNIKRFEWFMNCSLHQQFVDQLKLLPAGCWINIGWEALEDRESYDNEYEDVVDELEVEELNWPALGHRVERLSSLTINKFKPTLRQGVKFLRLKKLSFIFQQQNESLNCLFSSRFPCLEEFCFSTFVRLNDADFVRLFQNMATVTKLTIYWASTHQEIMPRLPRPLAIRRLEKLETVYLQITCLSTESISQLDDLIKQLEEYINEISWLRKLNVDLTWIDGKELKKTIVDKVKRLKMKQNRVKVDWISTNVECAFKHL